MRNEGRAGPRKFTLASFAASRDPTSPEDRLALRGHSGSRCAGVSLACGNSPQRAFDAWAYGVPPQQIAERMQSAGGPGGVNQYAYKDRAWTGWACLGHLPRTRGKRVGRRAEERPARLHRRIYE